MKHRFAKLSLFLGVPVLVAAGCSSSNTLPMPFGGDSGGTNGATSPTGGWTGNQGGGANVTVGGWPAGTTGGWSSTFGGSGVTSYGGYPVTTTGGTGNTSSTACSTTGSLTLGDGGYVQGTGFKGYAWTGTENPSKGSSISPVDFSACTASAKGLCASGSVAAVSDYTGVAMLGVNLNQAALPPNPLGTYSPTGTGVTITYSGSGTSLRVQIQAAGGGSDANLRWCATLTSGTQILWSQFNTKCWDGTGTAYAGQALESVMILAPGDNLAARPFNFCLTNLSI